jgi:predicted Zn-dependent protease
MALLTRDEIQALLRKALSYSKADECEVNLSGSEGGNLRYARNSVSTSGAIHQMNMQISSVFGKKLGIVTLNELDETLLEKAVRRSEELARLAPENPEFMPFLGPQEYGEPAKTFIPATAALTPADRAMMVEKSLRISKDSKLAAAGFLQNTTSFNAKMNSHGLFAYSTSTDVNFSVTIRSATPGGPIAGTNSSAGAAAPSGSGTPSGSGSASASGTASESGSASGLGSVPVPGGGSGYMAKDFNDVSKLDIESYSRTAAWKAAHSSGSRALEPGKYTVILEPAAAIVLLENIYFSLDARSADEGRSFLSKPGGKSRLGEKLVDEQVTIYSDPHHEDLPTVPFNGEGFPQQKIVWIEKGVLKNLYYSRYWAQQKGVKPLPAPDSFILAGGTASLDDLIHNTEKGILVTRLWYIRSVDPQTLLLTGLTRDGTFYIENGQIKFPIHNFRFNESPIIMLNNLETLGRPERTVSGESGLSAMIPPMKIREFTFTSLSDAI